MLALLEVAITGQRSRRLFAGLIGLALVACTSDGAGPDPDPDGGSNAPAAIRISAGNAQTVEPNSPAGLVVSVTTAAGSSVGGAAVTWSIVVGQGSLSATSTSTDGSGQASVTYTAGPNTGTDSIRASVGALAVTFHVNVLAPPVSTSGGGATLAAGGDFTCGIGVQGQAFCWGQGLPSRPFRLGDGFANDARYPVPVSGGLTFVAISAGNGHACGVTLSGAVACWGGNQSGQLGNGSTNEEVVPAAVTGLPSVHAVTAGAAHTCVIDMSSNAWCWGYNASGELGSGTSGGVATTPRQVAGGHNFKQIGAGDFVTCGVTDSEVGLCWGSNVEGQLGDGTNTSRSFPDTIAGGRSFDMLDVGFDHACGLTLQGQAFCWGRNDYGQLGDGTTSSRTSPVAVATGATFISINAGFLRTCAVDSDAHLHCWGLRPGSTSAFDATPAAVAPGETVATVAVGRGHTCFATQTGDAYCNGDNDHGKLGDGTLLMRPSPVRVLGRIRFATSPVLQTIAVPPLRVSDVGLGRWLSCAVRDDGVAVCWGDGDFGQLGNGMSRNSTVPIPLPLPAPATAIDAGEIYACALVQSGAAYCWGDGRYGRLGRGGTQSASTPVPVAGQLAFAQLGTGQRHACALTSLGEAYCWGNNSFGQLGIGTPGGPENCTSFVCSSVPVRVAGEITFKALSVGSYHNCAIAMNDALYCWGSNVGGALGLGSKTGPENCIAFASSSPGACSTSPIRVGEGMTFAAVSAAKGSHTCAIATDRVAYCWGPNGGRLGDGTSTERLTPTAVTGGFSWSRIYAGEAISCGITMQSAAYCWGGVSGHRLLGNTGIDVSPVPVPVSGGPAFVELAVGVDHSCGITDSGDLHCWGNNNLGQLGDPRSPFGGNRNPVPVWGLGLPDLR